MVCTATYSQKGAKLCDYYKEYIWGEIFIPAHQEYVWEQLLVDIALFNSVGIYDEERFAIENQIWIRELNARLDSFLQSVPSEHHYHLMVFLTGGHPLSRNDQMSNFFTKYLRHNRGGFVTYTLRPTFSTRVLHHMSEKGWGAFNGQFGLTKMYNSNTIASLHDQYWCHVQLDFETHFFGGTWDLEVGRPNVGLWQTMLARCNP